MKRSRAMHLMCSRSERPEDSIDIDQWKVLIACASTTPDTKGALVSRRCFILVHILTPLGWLGYGSPGRRTGLPQSLSKSALWKHCILTYGALLIDILTIEKDWSQWLFVFSEKDRNTGCKAPKNTKESHCG